ncbi:hypothetical protein [Dactylosporangium sp. NPDC048998]|uniref:hypothetical protein n=1 Tax=Dactylosporangium sp. NPDC048998 TaxID=3363976 RepID=UPI003711A7E3
MYAETVRRWWNGSWGRLNRRDVYVRTDGVSFEVEVRLGGANGHRWRREYTLAGTRSTRRNGTSRPTRHGRT